MSPFINIEYLSAQPILHRDRNLTLFSRVVRLRLPGGYFNLIWNKPTSVLVRNPDGSEQILRVPDLTQRFIIYLLLSGLFYGLLYRMIAKRRNL